MRKKSFSIIFLFCTNVTLTHGRLNELPNTIYKKILILILGMSGNVIEIFQGKNGWIIFKQWRPWPDAVYSGVWSGLHHLPNTLFGVYISAWHKRLFKYNANPYFPWKNKRYILNVNSDIQINMLKIKSNHMYDLHWAPLATVEPQSPSPLSLSRLSRWSFEAISLSQTFFNTSYRSLLSSSKYNYTS